MFYKRILYSVLLFIFLYPPSYAQEGKDGSKVLSSTAVVNEYTYLTSSAVAGGTLLQVNNSSLNANNRFSSSLNTGDLIMIIQVQGASVSTTNNASFGAVTAYNSAGAYELQEVISVLPSQIFIKCALKNSYSSSGKTMVVRIPRYSSLTIGVAGKISADAWNGKTGGVVALEVQGNMVVDGSIDVSALGFRGGILEQYTYKNWFTINTDYVSIDSNLSAAKGESIAGFYTEYDALGGRYGRGAIANGGGGGNSHNAGGGGGANGGCVTLWTGMGMPDTSAATYKTAWNLESQSFSKSFSAGGGRGGYSYGKRQTNPLLHGPGFTLGISDTAWGGDFRKNLGGLGGRPLDNLQGKLIFMGGGGGAGDANNNATLYGGGNGGGIVFLRVRGSISGNGNIKSNGGDGASSNLGNYNDASGGGGGGGSVLLFCDQQIGNITVSAVGGKGGDQYIGNLTTVKKYENEGTGGGGGGGYIASTQLLLSATVSGGDNGITNSKSLLNFPHNGATKGSDGITEQIQPPLQWNALVVKNDTVCPGETAFLSATDINGVGTNINWYTAPTGGVSFFTGENYSLVGNADQCFYVQLCDQLYRDTVCVFTNGKQNLNLGPDKNICSGDTLLLDAGVYSSYLWNTGAQTQTIKVTQPGTYIVNVPNNSCAGSDTVVVSPALTIDLGPDKTICEGNYFDKDAGSGWTHYEWSTGDTTQVLRVSQQGAYIIKVKSGNCEATDTFNLFWNMLPDFTVSSDTTCNGGSTTLSVSIAPGNWIIQWLSADGGTGPTKTVGSHGKYLVKVTNKTTLCADTASGYFIYGTPPEPYLGNDTIICELGVLKLKVDDPQWKKKWWNQSTADSVFVSDPGTYFVTVTNNYNCSGSDTINVISVSKPKFDLGHDVKKCVGYEITLATDVVADHYLWSTGEQTSSIDVNNFGRYWLTLTNDPACSKTDTVFVNYIPYPIVNHSNDTTLCFAESSNLFEISAESNPNYKYLWSTGDTTAITHVTSEGTYTVTVSIPNMNCAISESISLNDYCEPHIYFPNAFTPNADGKNDLFITPNLYLKSYHLMIFDRWGELLFETDDTTKGWNGYYKNNLVQQDVYVWKVDYSFEKQNGAIKDKTQIGAVTLIR